jgi:zinc transport system substrate-binding protein
VLQKIKMTIEVQGDGSAKPSRRLMAAILLATLGWILPGGQAPAAGPEKIPVVATILPLGDFCRRLGDERVTVQVLIPPGASPHVFEPAPSVIARAAQARIFVYIGAGLEPWADKLLSSRDTAGLAVVEAAHGIPLIKEAGEHHGEALEKNHQSHKPGKGEEKTPVAHKGHSHRAGNPHIWLDPVLAQEICRQITGALIRVDPEHRAYYETRLKDFLSELEKLHQEIQTRVATWSLKEYVSFHPAYTYFARRYGLKEVGVIEAAPGREPTPRHLKQIVTAIKRYGIRVVFAEPQLNPRVAQVIAQEAGVKVLLLDPIGGRPPYGSDYLQLMRYNLNILEEAMK